MREFGKPYRDAGFKPVDTLSSSQTPTFQQNTMVNERQPPRLISPQKGSTLASTGSPLQDLTNQPHFGKTSPLRNPTKADRFSIFNVPKPNQARPEHHRVAPPSHVPSAYPPNAAFRMPSFTNLPQGRGYPLAATQTPQPAKSSFRHPEHIGQPQVAGSPDVVEIARPANLASRPVHPLPNRVFSTSSNFQPFNAWKGPNSAISMNMTVKRDEDDHFNPDKAFAEDKFMGYDPSNYVDAVQASENIKALLEGAFEEDEDEKPGKLRLRKREKKDVDDVVALVDKLDSVKIAPKEEPREPEEEEDEDDGSVEGLVVKLLPHQIDGVAWMLDKEIGERKKNGVLPKGGILADDMGLGKTIQALSLILSNPRPSKEALADQTKRKIPQAAGKGTLVVAPLALIKQWESEINTKVESAQKLKILVHHGASRTKRSEDLKKYDIVITTYQTLTSEKEGSSDADDGLKVGCFGVHWYRVILDEAHTIKNRNAKMTKAAYALKAVYRWCLTGTPMQNNLDELQSLIHFLQIKPYNELKNWRDQISGPMRNGRGGLAMKRLQYFLKAFMKRRTKEVLKKEGGLNFGRGTKADGQTHSEGFKIVARSVQTVVAEFDGKERRFYNRLAARTERSLADMMGGEKTDYIGALVLLLRLRQICDHPELIRANFRKEKDSMITTSQSTSGSQTPRKSKSASTGDIDDVADMFVALSVNNRKCDVCQTKLNASNASVGGIRCSECEADLEGQTLWATNKKHGHKTKIVSKINNTARRGFHTKRIIDSDDEDEGDWVVPKGQQHVTDMGKAGGSEDEDAEGGGEWLRSDNSGTEDGSTNKVKKPNRTSHVDDDHNDCSAAECSAEGGDSSTGSGDDDDDDPTNKDVVMHRNRQMHSSTKIRRLLELLKQESSQHKFIVFSEFTSMLDLIEPFLRKQHYRFARYDGSMRNDDREASLDRLRNDPRTRILLCSLRCGSLGLNLTAASRVVILEPFWNPFVEEQAIDRVHRLNQTVDVTVYRITIADSVEERILALQERKRELAAAALEGGKAVAKLSMKDILALFRTDAEHDGGHGSVGGAVDARGSGGLLAPSRAAGMPPQPGAGTKARLPSNVLMEDAVYGRRW